MTLIIIALKLLLLHNLEQLLKEGSIWPCCKTSFPSSCEKNYVFMVNGSQSASLPQLCSPTPQKK